MPTQTIGFLSVTGSTQNIARVQDMWNRLTINLDPYITGTIEVLFTASVPKARQKNGQVRSVRGIADKAERRIRIRHGAKDTPNLLNNETQHVVLMQLFMFVDFDYLKRSNRAAIMALMSPGVGTYTAGNTWARWRSDKKGDLWVPYLIYATTGVKAYSNIVDPRPARFQRSISDLVAFRAAVVAAGTGPDPTGQPDGDDGDTDDGGGGYPPVVTGIYRPDFVSQFDAADASPANESKNCVFAAGAMMLDRHTMGGKKKSAQQLRVASGDKPATSAGLGDLKKAWAAFDETLVWSKTEGWPTFARKIAEGYGGILLTDLWKIPRKYLCSSSTRVQHALYINEVRANGDMLCFDPICRPTDNVNRSDPTILDNAYASHPKETQPHWIPQQHLEAAGRSFNRNRAGVQAGYTRKTQGGRGYGTPTGDVYAIGVRDAKWEDHTQAPSAPGEPAIVERRWEAGTRYAGFIYQTAGDLEIMDPEVVIEGEEGMIDSWSPTVHGYGVKGRSFYTTPAGILPGDNGVAFKAGRRHWYGHPWDIPTDYFWLDQPEWPDGEEYLRELIERANLSYGRQALGVVNRANLWADIELGALISVDLGLQGPHPTGIQGVVRIVGYAPDEDSGSMQLLTEWVDD